MIKLPPGGLKDIIPAQEREVINQIVRNSARICKLQKTNTDNVDGIPVAELEAENIRLSIDQSTHQFSTCNLK